ncbi:MAG TPA: TIM barrel protein [Pirellulales bacterium]|nr:TIM barrel protein [Pirellulales bacterium]
MFKNLDAKALGLAATQSETIELALSFGFRGIDLDIADFAAEVKTYGLPKARRLLDSAKLKVGSFVLPIDWQREDGFEADLKKLAELAGLAASVGARRVVTVIEPANDERPYHQNFEFMGRRLTELGSALEAHGLKLGVGFDASAASRQGKSFEFVHDLDAMLVLLSTVHAANVGLWLDVWQVWACGASLDEVRRKLPRGQVVAVTLSDAEEGPPESADPATRRLPGETGVIETAPLLATLAEAGYDGPVTPTPGPNQVASMRRDQLVKLAGEKLDAIWKAAGLGPSGKISASAGR